MKKDTTQAVKAYKNLPFLNSPDARLIRMMSEYLEPLSRFRRYNVADTAIAAARSAHHLNNAKLARAGIIGHVKFR